MDNFQPIKAFKWTDDEKQAFVDDFADYHFAKPYFPNRMMEYLRQYKKHWLDDVERGVAYFKEPKDGETFNEYLYRSCEAPSFCLENAQDALEKTEIFKKFVDQAERYNIDIGQLKEFVEEQEDEAIEYFNGPIFPLVVMYPESEVA